VGAVYPQFGVRDVEVGKSYVNRIACGKVNGFLNITE
jgi:hypothetical protein